MNFKTLSKVLNTSFSNVQNLANVLRDAFSNMEGGGSSGTEYSTTERVVGTWIDGKPLYQRTFSVPFANFTHHNDTYFTAIVSNSNEIIRNVDAIAYTTEYGNCSLGSRAYVQDDSLSVYWEVVQYYGSLAMHFVGQGAEIIGVTEAIVTYQYTKTTD